MENKHLFQSTKLNELAESLLSSLQNKEDFFQTTYLAFPNRNLEAWFKAYWLKNEDGVLANVQYLSLTDALLGTLNTDHYYTIVKHATLRDLTIKHLVLQSDFIPENIRFYFEETDGTNPAKLYDLANELSRLFLAYDNDAFTIPDDCWEKKIYDAVMKECLSMGQGTLWSIYQSIDGKEKFSRLRKPIHLFGLSVLPACVKKLIEECSKVNEVYTYELLDDKEIPVSRPSVFAAPSKLREMEILHGKICELLKNKENHYSDILVVAPDMKEYETQINRVFHQDGKEFPSIPYSVIDSSRGDSEVTSGIDVLFDIAMKGFCTRKDFQSLISNKTVMTARNITEDDIENWTTSLINMNVYRDSITTDDWDYAKKRVLLSKLAPCTADKSINVVTLKEGQVLPFSNISFDNESITKFSHVIDDIKGWEHFINENPMVSEHTLDSLQDQLSHWFSWKDKDENETNSQFRKVSKIIEEWRNLELFKLNLPLNTLLYCVKEASLTNEIHNGLLFTRGVSFMSFAPGNVLSAKYIFFLGADSASLPKKYVKGELDIRTDDSFDQSSLEKETFSLLTKNAEEGLTVSFVNKDLKTGEEFYPSPLISSFGKAQEYPLDETRKWSELYTRKEYKDKKYYDGLLQETSEARASIDSDTPLFSLERVKTSQMERFLKEPLCYKSESLLGRDFSNDEEMKEEFEPFSMNSLNRNRFITTVIKSLIDRDVSVIDDAEKERITDELKLEHMIPLMNDTLMEASIQSLISVCQTYKEYIDEHLCPHCTIDLLEDVVFQEDPGWVLTCDKQVCKGKMMLQGEEVLTYLPLKAIHSCKKPSTENHTDFLSVYVYSLMDLASFAKEEEKNILLLCGDNNSRTYSITPKEARETLSAIHKAMMDARDYIAKPAGMMSVPKTKLELVNDLYKDHGVWNYFADRRLFDRDRDICPDYADFPAEYGKVLHEHQKLIKYIEIREEEEKKTEVQE